jgi:phage shock protein A
MFEDWKRAWREAVENFQREMQAGEPQMPPRVRAMERELVSASGALTKLDREILQTQRELAAEQESEQVCRRREELARNAGDDETVRLAVDFAARHAERASVLTRKLAVLHDERALLDRDIGEMRRLVADAAAAAPPDSVGGATAASPTFDEEAAARDRDFSRLERDAREKAAAERLEELKRRMQG